MRSTARGSSTVPGRNRRGSRSGQHRRGPLQRLRRAGRELSLLSYIGLPGATGQTDYHVVFRSSATSGATRSTWALDHPPAGSATPPPSPRRALSLLHVARLREDLAPGKLRLDRLLEISRGPRNGSPDIYWVDASFLRAFAWFDLEVAQRRRRTLTNRFSADIFMHRGGEMVSRTGKYALRILGFLVDHPASGPGESDRGEDRHPVELPVQDPEPAPETGFVESQKGWGGGFVLGRRSARRRSRRSSSSSTAGTRSVGASSVSPGATRRTVSPPRSLGEDPVRVRDDAPEGHGRGSREPQREKVRSVFLTLSIDKHIQ